MLLTFKLAAFALVWSYKNTWYQTAWEMSEHTHRQRQIVRKASAEFGFERQEKNGVVSLCFTKHVSRALEPGQAGD